MSERSQSPSSDRNIPSKSKKRTRKHREEPSDKISESGQSKITQFFKNREEIKPKEPTALQTTMMGL